MPVLREASDESDLTMTGRARRPDLKPDLSGAPHSTGIHARAGGPGAHRPWKLHWIPAGGRRSSGPTGIHDPGGQPPLPLGGRTSRRQPRPARRSARRASPAPPSVGTCATGGACCTVVVELAVTGCCPSAFNVAVFWSMVPAGVAGST